MEAVDRNTLWQSGPVQAYAMTKAGTLDPDLRTPDGISMREFGEYLGRMGQMRDALVLAGVEHASVWFHKYLPQVVFADEQLTFTIHKTSHQLKHLSTFMTEHGPP